MEDTNFKMPDAGSWIDSLTPSMWILFAALTIGLSVVLWLVLFRPKKKQKRKRNSLRRKPNPTLAQTGGLPPPRDPEAPPRSPVP